MLYNICFGILYFLNSNVLLTSSTYIHSFIHLSIHPFESIHHPSVRPCVRPSVRSFVRSFVDLTFICWLIDLQELKHFYRDQIFLQRFPTSLVVRKNVTKLLVT
jgi:hypothetical protein